MKGYSIAARPPFLVPEFIITTKDPNTPGKCESTNLMLKKAPIASTGKIVNEKIVFLCPVNGMRNQQRTETKT